MAKRSLTLLEFLVVLCAIFILLGTFAIYANKILSIARQAALQNELINLRMSIEHYRVICGSLPEDLFALINKDFTFQNQDDIIPPNKFLRPFRVDKEGYLLDPFIHRYVYDNRVGNVRSQTKGYESW